MLKKKQKDHETRSTKHETVAKAMSQQEQIKKQNAAEVGQLKQRNEELEQLAKRALADYQNLQRRVEEQRQDFGKFATQSLVSEILPLIEQFDQALNTAPEQEQKSGWFAAVAMTVKQLKDILSREGLEEVNPEGQPFDPHFHEVVDVVPGQEDSKIVKVYQKGYKLYGKVIRAAKVQVTKVYGT